MNPRPANETWSLHRMTGHGAALLAGHVGLIWLLGARAVAPLPALPDGPVFHWINSPLEAPALATALLLVDPSLGVEPSIHGFSALGWLQPPPVRTIETEWTEPPRWLEPDLESFGHAIAVTLSTNKPAALAATYQPAVDQLLPRPRLPSEPVRPRTEWELSPDLRQRLQGEPATPPAWENADLLKDSIVDLSVDADGVVQSVRLWESSGLVAADQWAMALAWKLDFNEAPGTSRQSGRLVIRWRTLPPAPVAKPTP